MWIGKSNLLRRKLFTSTDGHQEQRRKFYMSHKPTGCPSLMARSFRMHAWFCRVCGFFFITNLFGGKRQRRPRVVWRSWYTFYSICCLSFLLWMVAETCIHARRRATRNHYRFDGSLYLIATSVLFVKVFANIVAILCGSSKMLEFYVRCVKFESRIAIPLCSCCSPRRYFWSDLRRCFLLVLYCVAFGAAVPLKPESNIFVDQRDRPIWKQVYIWLKIILLIIFYFVFDSIHIVALRAAGQVFVEYLKIQLEVLHDCTARLSSVPPLSPESRNALMRLVAVRLNFCEILDLTAAVNRVWNSSLVISTACTLLVLCTSAYEVCKNGPADWEDYAAFLYSVYLSYEFVGLASVSQSLIDTGTKMKAVCKTTCNSTDSNVQYQIEYLHGCIEPEQLCLSGGPFFKLNMSLLVSMASAIITYTVILLQSSQS